MTVDQIVGIVDGAYDLAFVITHYDRLRGRADPGDPEIGDGLARFIASEIVATQDPLPDQAEVRLTKALEFMEGAKADIRAIIEAIAEVIPERAKSLRKWRYSRNPRKSDRPRKKMTLEDLIEVVDRAFPAGRVREHAEIFRGVCPKADWYDRDSLGKFVALELVETQAPLPDKREVRVVGALEKMDQAWGDLNEVTAALETELQKCRTGPGVQETVAN